MINQLIEFWTAITDRNLVFPSHDVKLLNV